MWDNHANIRDFSAALGKSFLFYRGNLVLERILHRMSSAVLVVSEKEREAYGEMGFSTERFFVIPTCVDLEAMDKGVLPREEARRALGIEDGSVILFFGTLNYEPNLESALYISRELAPAVRRSVPDATVYIAGSGELGEDPSEGARMLGFVPDLASWLSAADVCIAPTWRGVGILTKVIDMLSADRATVVTPLARDGMPGAGARGELPGGRGSGTFLPPGDDAPRRQGTARTTWTQRPAAGGGKVLLGGGGPQAAKAA